MKQNFWIAVLLFVLSTNVVACVKEDTMPAPPLTTNEPSAPDNDENEEDEPPASTPQLRIVIGENTLIATLYDNPTARDFASRLPLTVDMSDFAGTEKIFTPSPGLRTNGAPHGTHPKAGDIASYAPWRNVAIYYRDGSSFSSDMIPVGRINGDISALKTSGSLRSVRFERVSQPTQYRLTYNSNGATSGASPAEVTANEGSSITLDSGSGLSRSRYSFVGWNTNTNGSGTDYPAGSSFTINENVTLYAKWQIVNSNSNTMKITIGSAAFTATFASNATVAAFKAMLPLTLNMSDFNNNEKVCSLPGNLTTSASNPGTIHTGDIMLYGSSSLVLFYETFSTSYSYSRIGQIDNVSGFKAALGAGNVTVKFELE